VPRIRAPFALLSGLFLVSIVYVLGNTPRPALALPAWAHGNLSPAGILLLAGPMTIAGAWVAWSVLGIYRGGRVSLDPPERTSAEASSIVMASPSAQARS
jgi:hypothetical protein